MKTNYFSRKLILSLVASIALAASPALAHPWHGGPHGWHRHQIRLGTGCWPWYRRRTNRRRTRLSLLRPARVLGAIRSMGTGISGLPIDARPDRRLRDARI